MSIEVDGTSYTSNNAENPVVITPSTQSIVLKVTGTNLKNGTEDNVVSYAAGRNDLLTSGYGWNFADDGSSATNDYSNNISWFAGTTTAHEIEYSNDGQTWTGTGVYVVYDNGIGEGEEDKAVITGVSIEVDGTSYTSNNAENPVVITPSTQTIVLKVTGTNLKNGTEDNAVSYAAGWNDLLISGYGWDFAEDGSSATNDYSDYISDFADTTTAHEIKYSNDGKQNWTGTGVYVVYDNGIGEGEEDKAVITGVSIEVDGTSYTSNNAENPVVITPSTQSIVLKVTGTNLRNGTEDNVVSYAAGRDDLLTSDYGWNFAEDGSSATNDYSDYISWFADCTTAYEIEYSNDGQNWTGTGVYVVYDNGIAEEDKAVITGVSIEVDGTSYTSNNAENPVVITPSTQSIVLKVTGTNLQNGTEDNVVWYVAGWNNLLTSGYGWDFAEDGSSATKDCSNNISWFADTTTAREIEYSNDGKQTWTGTGVYVVYDNGIAEEDKAVITGVSIEVDGASYTSNSAENPVVITPSTQTIVLKVTGTNLQNGTGDNVVWYAADYSEWLTSDYGWNFAEDGSSATNDYSNNISWFADTTTAHEIKYSNDGKQNWTGTGVYVVYDNGIGEGEEDKAVITGVSIEVDGTSYTSNNAENPVVITPSTQTIVLKVTGTNLQNGTVDNAVSYAAGRDDLLTSGYGWDFAADGSSATKDQSNNINYFADWTTAHEIKYSNDGQTWTGTGVYVVYAYGVTVNTSNNGTVTTDKEYALKGDTVTLTVTPAEGYRLDTLTVKDASDNDVSVENNRFAMPAGNVTVSAAFTMCDHTFDNACDTDCNDGCGYTRSITHTGEKEVKNAKKATCAEDGYTGDTYCKECGTKIADGIKIDKSTTHTWDAGVVTKEATPTEMGEKTYTCSVCKTTKKEEIPALGVPKVGEQVTSDDGATYKVTETGSNGGSITYVAPADKKATTVVIPATITIDNITYKVTKISDTAFAGNKNLTSVTIGDNVTSIPANAFKNLGKIVTVKMGTGVKSIGKNAFYGCSKLKNLTIGKNVTTIGDKAFYKCTALTKVSLPDKVKTIGKQAFYGCKNVTSVTIGKNVTTIDSKAFYGCSKLKTLTIKTTKLTTKKTGSSAFGKTPKSMTVKVPKKKFEGYKMMLTKRGVNKKAKFKKN